MGHSAWRKARAVADSVRRRAAGAIAILALVLGGCGGSSGGGSGCMGDCVAPPAALSAADVERILAQAAAEAHSRGAAAQIAVVDRVGNVVAVFEMTGAPKTIAISSGRGVNGGLDGVAAGTIPAVYSAISKAITGAYLSSNGNAFSTRTAGQIVQEHFDPQELQQPSGPLYGVQFSQLTCSDVNRKQPLHGSVGPKRSPLGLAADPGGLPLYKNGVLVGGIGVEANGLYTLDRDITDLDDDVEEHVAVAGAFGFAAPADIRGERITADGRSFRYVDSEATLSDPSHAPALSSLPGALVGVDGYTASSGNNVATAFGSSASGVRPDDGAFASSGGWVLVDAANANRFPPRDALDGSLRANEVRAILAEGIAIARRARGQIRRPLGSSAEVSVAIVDRNGDILGLVRTPDGPVFGIDVAVQKARTAMFFSHPQAAADLLAPVPARYLNGEFAPIARYADDVRAFLGVPGVLDGAVAWTPRAIGNLHRPFFPDGIEGPPGPLSTPIATWSPFNVGFQLDLVYNQFVKGVSGDLSEGCSGRLPANIPAPHGPDGSIGKLRNGVQIFPGGVPIYRGTQLVGAVGVSGDGVDQDDMIAFLGVANAARALGSGFSNAPEAMRADTLTPRGVRLRYVQCPQSPFNGSTEQNVCAGL
jgi:uncharacterized protein GlcG (DUF336 family)